MSEMTDEQKLRLERNRQLIEQQNEEKQKLHTRMNKIKHKIAVISGKGGVGKSTITVNLAAAFAQKGYTVGVLDADIHGPSVPRLLGLTGQQVKIGPPGVFPVPGPLGIRVISIDFFLPEEVPTIWRGPLKMGAIRQFLEDIVWGDLDILFIDLPPGTGDEPISIVQLIPELDGAIIVTTPQEVALLDSRKAANMFRVMEVPVLGIVENMSGLRCPHCGEVIEVFNKGGVERAAKETDVDFLGSIPLDTEIGRLGDQGVAFEGQDTDAGKAFDRIVSKVTQKISEPNVISVLGGGH